MKFSYMDVMYGLIGGIGFLTTLPAGKKDRLAYLLQHTYLFSIVGILIGLIIGLSAVCLMLLLPGLPGLSAVLVVIIIYFLCGLNHLDALSDFGDGIIAHGSRDKKINAMKDSALGVGGVFFIVLYILLLFINIRILAVSQTYLYLGAAMLIAEVSAKHSMITIAWLGKPIHQGMGSFIVDNTFSKDFLLSFIVCMSISIIGLGIPGLVALILANISSWIILGISKRHFGGINGDCIGTCNEMGRLIALISLVIIFNKGLVIWMPW
ncbi:MAG: adenosylcobinamide-GDP ribazoletransferase [ANME-2 cluster archaeon HR1]|nr:MAG: adenosylcobinamide-GDP ribazoletransferase [ANME-2 cluster archaeon HR1]